MTIDRWITDAAVHTPDKCAIEFGTERLGYRAFAQEIETTVAELRQHGISHGDRVAWYGLNSPRVFVLLFACARIGAIFVPLNWRLADEEIAEIVRHCGPAMIYWDAAFQDKAQGLPRVPPACAPDQPAALSDPVLIVYTSGSTGKPKGVVLAQTALVANAKMSVHAHGLTPKDVVLNVLPLFHVGGLNILPTPAFSIGASVILHQSFDPVAMVQDLQRATAAITVPTVLGAVLNTPDWHMAELGGLRCLSIGSTDVPRDMIRQVHSRGIPLLQIYGATETAPFAIYQTHGTAMETEGSIGRAGTCDVRLAAADGSEVPVDHPGEIWVRGDNTLLEYWRNPELTQSSITDGWFKTGDVARVDADGQYHFVDRIKQIIISGGENIYPAEIERILSRHPNITELSVVGVPDPIWGETPVVVAVRGLGAPSAQVSEPDLLSQLTGRLARYKHPRRVVFVDALPRNAMGKVSVDRVRALIST